MVGHWMVLSSLLSSSSATLLSFPIVITITIFGIVSIVVGFFASQAVSSGSSVGVGWSAVSALVWTHVDTTATQRRSSQSYKYSKYWCCQKCQSRLDIIILRLSAAASAWFLKLLTWSFVENYLLNIYHFRQWTIFLLNCLLTDKIWRFSFSQPCSVLHL